MDKVKSNDMIYAVYIPYDTYQPVKLFAYKAEQKENGYECEEPLFTSFLCSTSHLENKDFNITKEIGSGTAYYILDSKEAVEKYEIERDKRIQICRGIINACEKVISFMESFDANVILKGDENNG